MTPHTHSTSIDDFSGLLAVLKMRQLTKSVKFLVTQSKAQKFSNLNSLVTPQLSKSLCLMSEYFLAKNELHLAKLAAFWSLQKILKVELKIQNVAKSFSMMLKVLRVTGESTEYQWIQEAAVVQTSRALFSSELNLNGLTEIARVYMEIMIC